MNTAGRFVAEGNGVGLVATSQGWGSALYSLASGTGYAGHFVGGNGVRIDGMCDVDAFQMYPYSTAGHVLTSDANGVGTWQAPTGGGEADNDWTVVGDDMYATVSGNVGIGTITPEAPFDVRSDGAAMRVISGSPPTSLPQACRPSTLPRMGPRQGGSSLTPRMDTLSGPSTRATDTLWWG